MGVVCVMLCNVMWYSVRDGVLVEQLAKWLVPGDLVHISLGDRVPADIRILEVGGRGNGCGLYQQLHVW